MENGNGNGKSRKSRLVLTRDVGQAVVIDGPAVVRVVRARRGEVRLAVEADRSTKVDREEVRARKEART